MRAVLLNDYGASEQLVMADVAIPLPRAGEVLIKVAYAGLRWGDIMQRHGFPSRARPTPFIAGQEAAGVIEAVGPGVEGFECGMRVIGLPVDGAWAEYVSVPVARVTLLPAHVSLSQALVYPVNLLTAYYAVLVWAKVRAGERVLLHAAAGGVGLLALQVMKRRLRDVCVVAVAGGPRKVELALQHGADHAIDYKRTDYVAEVNRLLGPKASGFMTGGARGGGVDVSLNGVSGPTLQRDPLLIRKRGRWVVYGWAGGRGVFDTSSYGYDGITIMPFSSIAWHGTSEHATGQQFVHDWLARETLLEPTIFPLEQAAEVSRAMERGDTQGKTVFEL